MCCTERTPNEERTHLTQTAKSKQGVAIQDYLNSGNQNEKHAMATVVSYALPLYFPDTIFVESGASFTWCEETNEPILEVSADGLICCLNQNTSGCLNQSVSEMMKVQYRHEVK